MSDDRQQLNIDLSTKLIDDLQRVYFRNYDIAITGVRHGSVDWVETSYAFAYAGMVHSIRNAYDLLRMVNLPGFDKDWNEADVRYRMVATLLTYHFDGKNTLGQAAKLAQQIIRIMKTVEK